MTPSKAESNKSIYEIIPLDTFGRNLKDFDKSSRSKIKEKIKNWLSVKPSRYPLLHGHIRVAGVKIYGLRHVKVGVRGKKGGAYVLYRICEDCLNFEYWKKSDVRCQFCDDSKPKRVVLFDVHPRSFDYGR